MSVNADARRLCTEPGWTAGDERTTTRAALMGTEVGDAACSGTEPSSISERFCRVAAHLPRGR